MGAAQAPPPVQGALGPEDPRALVKGPYRLGPLARFLSKGRYPYDRGAAIAPWGFALGWGRVLVAAAGACAIVWAARFAVR
ncbi:hypothetical protein [Meiothermus luteus]|uniref:hypothetical protein n=1 Tax=Meiothermus luteus TaxID=2026184 RepID=UPI0015F80643|nr:hypothetical protein [Meiothermus luteus]